MGGVTDVCIMQFALTQKAYFNECNQNKSIIVIENAVQTFNSDTHDGNQMHTFALFNMLINGINIYTI
ncbi:MAG: putative pyrazinamidase/nicotinamidase [Clostridia bacterium]|nr:putative pyrazinamidase/nicotinamidase [Clostridia bacterium]